MSKPRLHVVAVGTLGIMGLSGCASFQMPARAAYHATKPLDAQRVDDGECQAFAKDRTGYDPVTSAVTGGIVGGVVAAALGAGFGAAVGGVFRDPGRGAVLGATLGFRYAGEIGAQEMQRMHDLYSKHYSVCMRAKGYVVE